MFITRSKSFAIYSVFILLVNWALSVFLGWRLLAVSRRYAKLGVAVAAVVKSLDSALVDGRLCAPAASAESDDLTAPQSSVLGIGRLRNWVYADIQEPQYVLDGDKDGGGHWELQVKRYYVRRSGGKGGSPTSASEVGGLSGATPDRCAAVGQ